MCPRVLESPGAEAVGPLRGEEVKVPLARISIRRGKVPRRGIVVRRVPEAEAAAAGIRPGVALKIRVREKRVPGPVRKAAPAVIRVRKRVRVIAGRGVRGKGVVRLLPKSVPVLRRLRSSPADPAVKSKRVV